MSSFVFSGEAPQRVVRVIVVVVTDWFVWWIWHRLSQLSWSSGSRRLWLFMQPPMRQMRICFMDVFFCFFAFSIRHKNTRQPFSGTAERIFIKLLPNDSGENGVCIGHTQMGARPPINFLGAKNYTLHTWWWRLASDWELVCWLWHGTGAAASRINQN